MRSLALLLLLVAASIGASRDDTTSLVPASAVADPLPIRVPPTGAAPGPVQPFPAAALKLTPETICVIDSDVSVRVLASPSGFVRVVRDTGPLRVRGRFIDGNGRTETRNLQGKFLYFVEPAANGRVELLVIPTGEAKPDDSDVIRRTIDVQAGEGPQPPPPDPPNPPEPKPLPSADAQLVKQYAEGLDKDIAAGRGDKVAAAKLAQSYLSTADALEADNGTVKTIGDMFTLGFKKSEEAGVPRLPYLENTRNVTGNVFGTPFGTSPITDANRGEWVKAFRRCGLALKEASK